MQDEVELQNIEFTKKPLRNLPIKLTPPPESAKETLKIKRDLEESLDQLNRRRKDPIRDLYHYLVGGTNLDGRHSNKDGEVD